MDDEPPGLNQRDSRGQGQDEQAVAGVDSGVGAGVAVGIVLRRLRRSLGWSRADLARRSGMSQSHLGRIERGASQPGHESLITLTRIFGVSLADFGTIAGQANQADAEIAAILSRLAIPSSVWHEFVGLAPAPREALINALQRLTPPDADRRHSLPEIESHLLACGVKASTDAIMAGIERFGLSPIDFLRSAAQLEELSGERVVLTDRIPMTPLSFGIDQMQIFRATFGIAPPNPMLLKWWGDARRTAITETLRTHDSRTICALDCLERYLRTGQRAPGISVPFDMIRKHLLAIADLLRSNRRYRVGLIKEMPRLAFRIKGDALALVTKAGFVLGPNREHHGTALRFTRSEVVAVFQSNFDTLWEDIPEVHKDSDAIADWLEAWSTRIGDMDYTGQLGL